MTEQLPFVLDQTIWRLGTTMSQSGLGRSSIYSRVSEGLLPSSVSLGGRAVGWIASEVMAVNAARIAGKTDEEIRKLVRKLESSRASRLAIACAQEDERPKSQTPPRIGEEKRQHRRTSTSDLGENQRGVTLEHTSTDGV